MNDRPKEEIAPFGKCVVTGEVPPEPQRPRNYVIVYINLDGEMSYSQSMTRKEAQGLKHSMWHFRHEHKYRNPRIMALEDAKLIRGIEERVVWNLYNYGAS